MAGIVTSGTEMAEMMGWDHNQSKAVQRSLFVELSDTEQIIVDVIVQCHEISIDEINIRCREFTPSQIAGILLGLELRGVIECKPGKIYRIL